MKKSSFFIILSIMISFCFAEDKLIRKPSYVYTSSGKPDPFKPFIEKQETYSSISPEELKKLRIIPLLKTELQRISISELKLVAIVKIGKEAIAMVEGPDGKGYIVKKGMAIGNKGGIVEDIIYENRMTASGIKAIRKILIKEPFFENGKIRFRYIEMSLGEE